METTLNTLEVMSAHWSTAMWQASWQGGLAILIAWIICRAFPRLPQPAQSWLWRLVFLKLLLGLVLVAPAIRVPILPKAYVDQYTMTGVPTVSLPSVSSTRPDIGSVAVTTPAPSVAAVRSSQRLQLSIPALCFLLWLLGVAVGGTYLLRAFRRLSALLRSSTFIDSGVHVDCLTQLMYELRIARMPRLMSTPEIGSPLLVGTLTPTLLIPETFLENEDHGLLRQVYAHELAHLRRHDLRWNWLLTIGHILFFVHPLVWLAKREWLFWQEAACDVKAMEATGSSQSEFGQALLLVVNQHRRRHHEIAAVGIGEAFNLLKRRLQVVQQFAPAGQKRLAIATALVLLIGALMLLPFKLGVFLAAAGNGNNKDYLIAHGAKDEWAPDVPHTGPYQVHAAVQPYAEMIFTLNAPLQDTEIFEKQSALYQALKNEPHIRIIVQGNMVIIRTSAQNQQQANKQLSSATVVMQQAFGEGQFIIPSANSIFHYVDNTIVNHVQDVVTKRFTDAGLTQVTVRPQGNNGIVVTIPDRNISPETIKGLLAMGRLEFVLLSADISITLGSDHTVASIRKNGRTITDLEALNTSLLVLDGSALKPGSTAAISAQGKPGVTFELATQADVRRFADITSKNLQRYLAIVLDDKILSASMIKEPLMSGCVQLSGGFNTMQEARQLAVIFNTGALPAPLTITEVTMK